MLEPYCKGLIAQILARTPYQVVDQYHSISDNFGFFSAVDSPDLFPNLPRPQNSIILLFIAVEAHDEVG